MTLIEYAGVSTETKNLDRQIEALLAAGVTKRNIYKEKITENRLGRKVFNQMIDELEEGLVSRMKRGMVIALADNGR
ncbi:MAG: recombinase family protein [bacterium]|nr:recombinase family protein [bacterium]